MATTSVQTKRQYSKLIKSIGDVLRTSREKAIKTINAELVRAYWEIGRHIVEFEQQGNVRAEYGSDLMTSLSRDLKLEYGKGFGRRNVQDMRRIYLIISNLADTVCQIELEPLCSFTGSYGRQSTKLLSKTMRI